MQVRSSVNAQRRHIHPVASSGTPENKASEAKPNLKYSVFHNLARTVGLFLPSMHMYKEQTPTSKAHPYLQAQVNSMAAITYGLLVVACHAKCGYLTTPIMFGDFPAMVGSPYFLGVIPAAQATSKAALKATATRGSKPRPSQGRVFSSLENGDSARDAGATSPVRSSPTPAKLCLLGTSASGSMEASRSCRGTEVSLLWQPPTSSLPSKGCAKKIGTSQKEPDRGRRQAQHPNSLAK
ncbi:hypothetical protein Taro_011069 [Colocasia esculenta]|uniref:Uncharacterized protein n=1 Tax=Colocasia esculenta TaxID=4460 RepID=A0A843U977_COLES|nr:hypothetical protein [Colocasia esculenta]